LKKKIDFDALAKEYKPKRVEWKKEEIEILEECTKRGFPARFVFEKGLIPGRTCQSIDSQIKRIRNEKA